MISGGRYIDVSKRALRFVLASNLALNGLHVRMLSIVILVRARFGDKVEIDPEWLAGEAFSTGSSRASASSLGWFISVSMRSSRSRIAKLAGSKLRIELAYNLSRLGYQGREKLHIRRVVNRVCDTFSTHSLTERTCRFLVITLGPSCSTDLTGPNSPSARIASSSPGINFFRVWRIGGRRRSFLSGKLEGTNLSTVWGRVRPVGPWGLFPRGAAHRGEQISRGLQ